MGNGVAGFSFRVSRCSEASSKNLKLETRNFFSDPSIECGNRQERQAAPLVIV
jgi:hypothetical protein